MMSHYLFLGLVLVPAMAAAERTVDADLLIVGGSESAVAAAVQAAALGVGRIALVNDIAWLGGQFSSEGVGAIDEWTLYRSRRVNFPRSGLFLDVVRMIRQHNGSKYGVHSPGNAMTATETIEPVDAQRIFARLIEPHVRAGRITYLNPYRPIRAAKQGSRLTAMTFEHASQPNDSLTVRALLTIDASDWGDAIRVSGARYSAGPDLRSRFGEQNAPETLTGEERNEMNPLTYCLVARESARDQVIPKPEGYDERSYLAAATSTLEEFRKTGWPSGARAMGLPLFVDTAYPEGTYSSNNSHYSYRRLVDGHHNGLKPGSDKVLLNFTIQDYPTFQYPRRVVDALERNAPGASKKNVVDMTYAQREIVFEDAKRHSLGFLHFLQTKAHVPGRARHFRRTELTDEFGTRDRAPWKIYIREGLRLEAMYMLREGDLLARGDQISWARMLPPDNVFGFQFNMDFHPTRRVFLNDNAGPWMVMHTANRNWTTHSDRAGFPYRSLVPVETDGLLGAGKNLGVSSIVSSALRLHGQTMMAGQAAATAAAICLREKIQPRDLATRRPLIREMQLKLTRGVGGYSGVLLWPYHDLSTEERHFVAANMLAVRGILTGDPGSLDFQAWRTVSRAELSGALARATASVVGAKAWRDGVEKPGEPADWKTLHEWLSEIGWHASPGLARSDYRLGPRSPALTRAEMANHVWNAIRDLPERHTH